MWRHPRCVNPATCPFILPVCTGAALAAAAAAISATASATAAAAWRQSVESDQ